MDHPAAMKVRAAATKTTSGFDWKALLEWTPAGGGLEELGGMCRGAVPPEKPALTTLSDRMFDRIHGVRQWEHQLDFTKTVVENREQRILAMRNLDVSGGVAAILAGLEGEAPRDS